MSTTCYNCGNEYKNITSHWSRSNCSYRTIDATKLSIIHGLLLGDGCIANGPNKSYFILRMSNREFLQVIDEKLDWLSLGVNKYDSQQGRGKDMYSLQTLSHPTLTTLREKWYPSSKVVPEDMKLTSEKVKLWYVCDGNLDYGSDGSLRPASKFSIHTLSSYKDNLSDYLDKNGIESSVNKNGVRVSADSTDDFLTFLGEPYKGFEYKWTENFK